MSPLPPGTAVLVDPQLEREILLVVAHDIGPEPASPVGLAGIMDELLRQASFLVLLPDTAVRRW